MLKKILKYTFRTLLVILLVLMLVPALLYIPAVQDFVRGKAVGYASRTLGMDLSVERLRLSFPLRLSVDNTLLTDKGDGLWECLTRPGRKTRTGVELTFGDGLLTATVEAVQPDGNRLIRFHYEGIFLEILDKLGTMPLPPYIHEKLADQSRYQTVYAKNEGSAAAPTAGLHFTPELLERIRAKGVTIVPVTLHVGLGTFRPVQVEDVDKHVMHSEWYQVTEEAANTLNAIRAGGGRLICVGTTSERTIETVATEDGIVHPGAGDTAIFIYPGKKIKAVDALITNFHLPQSTLLMLVSTFMGRETALDVYREAVQKKYRFFSFGDAMFIE